MTDNAEPNANPTTEPPANPPTAPAAEPPATPPIAPPAEQNGERNHASNREVIAAVESLPEKIVNSLREAFTTANPPAASTPPTGESSAPPADPTPGKNSGTLSERFNKWYWGTK